jgi:predicted transcriptional regulator
MCRTQINMTTTAPHNGTETSRDAALSIQEACGRLERMVVDAITAHGGLMCDAVEEITGLSHQCASARINALTKRGVLKDSGVKARTRSGRKAIVWVKAAQQ